MPDNPNQSLTIGATLCIVISMDNVTDTKDAYTPAEAAKRLSISVKTVYREIQRGNLKAKKIGGGTNMLISRQSLLAYLEEE